MKKFSTFYLERFSFDEKTLKASFFYSFDKKEFFEENIFFSTGDFSPRKQLDKEVLKNLLFHTHLALGISYYKLFPTKKLILDSGYLDEYQLGFWKNFYKQGLGEFFIKNDIDPNAILEFQNIKNSKKYKKIDFELSDKMLLALGGGKDSLVSYELIKKANLDFDSYVFGKLDPIKENVSKKMGKPPLLIKRSLSQNLFNLNEKGYYNGHVPITGIIAFVSELVCYLYDYKYIVLSNEKSASQENTIWKSLKINHQYSKSLEFEKDFNSYVEKYISSNVKYFSILRGLYEYKIAKLFSKQKEFFNIFSSCNKNFKINKKSNKQKLWCCECEKCSFVFLILSPFLKIEELEGIFGENLFEKSSLKQTFKKLFGMDSYKPFECVGTYDESLLSFKKAIEKYRKQKKPLAVILKELEPELNKKLENINLKKLEEKLLKIYDEDIIPKEIKQKINYEA